MGNWLMKEKRGVVHIVRGKVGKGYWKRWTQNLTTTFEYAKVYVRGGGKFTKHKFLIRDIEKEIKYTSCTVERPQSVTEAPQYTREVMKPGSSRVLFGFKSATGAEMTWNTALALLQARNNNVIAVYRRCVFRMYTSVKRNTGRQVPIRCWK